MKVDDIVDDFVTCGMALSPRAMDAPCGRCTDIITYVINNITIKGNHKPNLLAFLLQIIKVLPIIISEQLNGENYPIN